MRCTIEGVPVHNITEGLSTHGFGRGRGKRRDADGTPRATLMGTTIQLDRSRET